MRAAFLALSMTLTACAPPTPPAAQPAADPAAAQSSTASAANGGVSGSDNAALLSAAPAGGQWFFRADEGVIGAGFGEPQSEFQFSITCTMPSGALTLVSGHELFPDQTTTLRILTATQSIDLPARSFNEGLPSITAELTETAPQHQTLIAALSAAQDRFGVGVGGQTQVFPWNDAIARTLAACE